MPPNPQAATVPTAYSAVVIPRSLRRRAVRTLDMEPPGTGSRPVRAPPPRGCVPGCSDRPADPMGDVPAGDEGRITAATVDGGGRGEGHVAAPPECGTVGRTRSPGRTGPAATPM